MQVVSIVLTAPPLALWLLADDNQSDIDSLSSLNNHSAGGKLKIMTKLTLLNDD